MNKKRQAGLPSSTRLEPIVTALLTWSAVNGRTFSWRTNDDPFYVLVSEILLKKTGAQTVNRFMPGFAAQYPHASSLAAASVGDLIAVLAPLGLSRQRAGQLKALAQALLDEHQGQAPLDVAGLLSLPGVGRYTAGMVAAVCGNVAAAAVDSNVARVISRVFAITPSHAEPRKSTNIWVVAEALVKRRPEAPAEVTWAILDLAATVCTARNPYHATCPLFQHCVYGQRMQASS